LESFHFDYFVIPNEMRLMDIKLHFIEKGTGFPLILLHGNSEDHSYFEHQINYFSAYYRVIAVDTRGHGRSPRGEKHFTIEQFANDLFDFMTEYKINKTILLGFSDGGNIALTFALMHPDRVEKLVLNGANLFPSGMKVSVYWWVLRHYWKAKLVKDVAAQEMMLLMLKQPHIQPELLPKLKMPVLIIVGDHDMIRKSHTKMIYNQFENSQLNILEGSHFCANEHFESFNRVVHSFLKK
jgi:Predicted hydrolases or acyltransferases (alpha/beta hydrolase superfamily)